MVKKRPCPQPPATSTGGDTNHTKLGKHTPLGRAQVAIDGAPKHEKGQCVRPPEQPTHTSHCSWLYSVYYCVCTRGGILAQQADSAAAKPQIEPPSSRAITKLLSGFKQLNSSYRYPNACMFRNRMRLPANQTSVGIGDVTTEHNAAVAGDTTVDAGPNARNG